MARDTLAVEAQAAPGILVENMTWEWEQGTQVAGTVGELRAWEASVAWAWLAGTAAAQGLPSRTAAVQGLPSRTAAVQGLPSRTAAEEEEIAAVSARRLPR